ncbi:hypothetical protein H0H93_007724 [Arthromyces matolae]|nr:hypothetical protein H0H93_007724 [Arthromyces matolae]
MGLSALREISLVREMCDAGAPGMDFLYLGYYIHSCQKMRYKADYAPSYLTDPETHNWYPVAHCLPLLDKYRYASFSHPDESRNTPADDDEDTRVEPDDNAAHLEEVFVISRVTENCILTEPLTSSPVWDNSDDKIRDSVMTYIGSLGMDIAKEINLEHERGLELGNDGMTIQCTSYNSFTLKNCQLRRQIRERRQYVYAKSQEAQERQTYERKQQLKDALATGKTLPTELKKDAKGLGKDLAFDEAQTEPTTHIDNEYSRAGTQDPKIVITTSRDPSSKLLQFTKEMRLVFPNSTRINRGNYVVKELADACRANDVTDLIVLHEHRGVPGIDAMIVSHFPHGPTVYFTLNNVSLRHDIGTYKDSTVSEQYPHLILENFTSTLGHRVRDVLKYLFPVPKEESKRVMTFANEDDFISFRHHVFVKIPPRQVQLAEVGPRFEMKPYEIRQGTIEQNEAEREWVLAHYARTTKKRTVLGGPSGPPEPPTKKLRR